MAVDGALGDEKARSDLLVGQAIGDQACDLGLSLPEQTGTRIVGSRGGGMNGFTQRRTSTPRVPRWLTPERGPVVGPVRR